MTPANPLPPAGADHTREEVRQLADRSLADHDPTGWFEQLYALARSDPSAIPWADMTPNPNFIDWLSRHPLRGDSRPALVVGCGLGDDAHALAALGFDVTAFDISPTAIQWCRQRFGSAIRFCVADLFDPPESWQRRFDFVLEAYTLHVLPSELHQPAMARIAGFVKPRRTLLVITRARDQHDPPRQGLHWPLSRHDLQTFTESGLTQVAFEDYIEPSNPPVRRFRAQYQA